MQGEGARPQTPKVVSEAQPELAPGSQPELAPERPAELAPEPPTELAPEDDPRVRVAAAPTRCPYCHDGLGGELAACAGCGARHHAACWDAHARCATCGEDDALRARAPEPALGDPSPAWAAVYAALGLACAVAGASTPLLPLWAVPSALRVHVVREEWVALLLASGALALAWWALAAWCVRAARRAWRGDA